MPWFQLKFLQGLNLLELAALIASGLTELLLCLGVVVNCWCGMPHAYVCSILPVWGHPISKSSCTVSSVHSGGIRNLRCNGPRNGNFFEGPWVLSKTSVWRWQSLLSFVAKIFYCYSERKLWFCVGQYWRPYWQNPRLYLTFPYFLWYTSVLTFYFVTC